MAQVVDAAICSKTADHQPPFAQHEFEEQLARHSTPGAASMELTNTFEASFVKELPQIIMKSAITKLQLADEERIWVIMGLDCSDCGVMLEHHGCHDAG